MKCSWLAARSESSDLDHLATNWAGVIVTGVPSHLLATLNGSHGPAKGRRPGGRSTAYRCCPALPPRPRSVLTEHRERQVAAGGGQRTRLPFSLHFRPHAFLFPRFGGFGVAGGRPGLRCRTSAKSFGWMRYWTPNLLAGNRPARMST